jgi:hypothetical protein
MTPRSYTLYIDAILERCSPRLEPVELLDWTKGTKDLLWAHCAEVLALFTELLKASYKLLETLGSSRELQDLHRCEALIARQYFFTLVVPFKQSFAQRIQKSTARQRSADEKLLRKLEALASELVGLLEALPLDMGPPPELKGSTWRGWIPLSVFTPVYAALASQYPDKLGDEFCKQSFSHEVKAWKKCAKLFCPSVVVFDLTHHIIGETRPNWPNAARLIREWEQGVCDQRFTSLLRQNFEGVRKEIANSIQEGSNTNEQIAKARFTIQESGSSRFFTACTSQCLWWAMEGRDLTTKPQCPSCQVLYPDVLLVAQNPEKCTYKAIDTNWSSDPHQGHQCAEADVIRLHRDVNEEVLYRT